MIKGTIYSLAKVVGSNNLSLGEKSQIDDFCFINAGKKTEIGRNVHIASFSTIVGGGECVIGDFAGLSAGCRIITASDDFSGPYLTNPTVHADYTNVTSSKVEIGRHAIIGTNSVIFPGVTIGEGCAVGAGAVVRKNLKPWTVYAAIDGKLKELKIRDREAILDMERQYLESEHA
ncbi:TPA: acyltransferase [Vibrio parahaemolyticus]|uniref:acyltransferase n=1 Tax=Vibrio parahaemolyticus TaxID=670 RepID=UPI001120D918|nr:acyltransferase [Vibrio parahaemolyticus]EHR6470832.1 acyltransferase [Vibrio parahaemolyticus]MBE3684810.1 acyltransferase [Vibrio parahaemolyticus]MBE3824437.1 acyltransferase [Vibrio parahaemolyticus]MBE4243258.1 acyltransferase [Vibrio parahaemolyticus]TOJ68319.1 acetyltransferase [Vibrio parahaemolyticus]